MKHLKTFENYSSINNDEVKVGDRVSYEKESSGYKTVGGSKISNKTLETGTVIDKIMPTDNMSPIFKIENDNGEIDEVTVGSVIDILSLDFYLRQK
jgi:hypothetical protein